MCCLEPASTLPFRGLVSSWIKGTPSLGYVPICRKAKRGKRRFLCESVSFLFDSDMATSRGNFTMHARSAPYFCAPRCCLAHELLHSYPRILWEYEEGRVCRAAVEGVPRCGGAISAWTGESCPEVGSAWSMPGHMRTEVGDWCYSVLVLSGILL